MNGIYLDSHRQALITRVSSSTAYSYKHIQFRSSCRIIISYIHKHNQHINLATILDSSSCVCMYVQINTCSGKIIHFHYDFHTISDYHFSTYLPTHLQFWWLLQTFGQCFSSWKDISWLFTHPEIKEQRNPLYIAVLI